MDPDDHELLNLAKEIEDARKHYFRSRDHFRLALKEIGAAEESTEKLLSLAEEFGMDHVSDRLSDSPRELGFSRPYAVGKGDERDRVLDLLTVAKDADRELCELVASRENILCARNRERARRYNIDGQEVIFNVEGGKIRAMDSDREEPLRIDLVPPRGFPERSLEEMRRRDRIRDDDRD
jgi:hypothetical protein